jgi:hypothetical protein
VLARTLSTSIVGESFAKFSLGVFYLIAFRTDGRATITQSAKLGGIFRKKAALEELAGVAGWRVIGDW